MNFFEPLQERASDNTAFLLFTTDQNAFNRLPILCNHHHVPRPDNQVKGTKFLRNSFRAQTMHGNRLTEINQLGSITWRGPL